MQNTTYHTHNPPKAHAFLSLPLQSNKSSFFLITVSSSAISLNISWPNLSNHLNSLLDSVCHAAVSNIFNNTGVTNVIDNNEPHISRLFNNTAIHNSDIISEFVHRGNNIVDPNILHGILAVFTNNPAFIAVIVLPLIYPLSGVIQEMTNRLARLARLMQPNLLSNSQWMHSYRFTIPTRLSRRLSTCLSSCGCNIRNNCCNTVKWVKDKYLTLKPNWYTTTCKSVKERHIDFIPNWIFDYNGSDSIPSELRDTRAYHICTRHSWKEIQSPNSILNWRCAFCQSGPHWMIWECLHCKIKSCRRCIHKPGK